MKEYIIKLMDGLIPLTGSFCSLVLFRPFLDYFRKLTDLLAILKTLNSFLKAKYRRGPAENGQLTGNFD